MRYVAMTQLMLLFLAPVVQARDAAPEIPVELQLKVVGELHGVIQDRLPVTVAVDFETPEKPAEMAAARTVGERANALKNYLDVKREQVLGRIAGPGLVVEKTYEYLPSIVVTISTIEALIRVLEDPSVVWVTGDDPLDLNDIH